MANKTLIFAGAVLLGFTALLVYVILTRTMPRPRDRRRAAPARTPTKPIYLLENRASGGLTWSREEYPQQYEGPNLRTAALVGLNDSDNERCMDVAGRAYSRASLSGFSYTDTEAKQPKVSVTYLARAETFAGKLTATGLKPNFAYQIKLRGRFAEDREGFERIGYTGRWRLPGRGTNYRDEDYEASPNKEEIEAYLLFDFLVTDPEGAAEKWFYADSTLHVLWNASTQRGPSPIDGCQIPVVRMNTAPALYANPRADRRVQRIYAETEEKSPSSNYSRKPIGRAFLPPGTYQAELVLTEESFHGFGDAGYWATVMAAPVEFEVVDRPRPVPGGTGAPLVGSPLSLEHADLVNLEAHVRTAGQLDGVAATDDPQVIFRPHTFAPDARHVFACEAAASGKHTLQIFLDLGEGFERRPTYTVTSRGRTGWQGFVVEMTSMVAGRTVRVRVDPSTRRGPIGLRKAGFFRLKD